ncbi:MAG: GNAT family N-acetyltransferase [Candidatus Promineifilaceae bacterium]
MPAAADKLQPNKGVEQEIRREIRNLMQINLDDITVVNNQDENRFEVRVAEHLAVIDYYRLEDEIVYTHTGVPEPLSGQGLASKMAEAALEYARGEGLKVVPQCPFVRAYMRRHKQYQDLLSANFGAL